MLIITARQVDAEYYDSSPRVVTAQDPYTTYDQQASYLKLRFYLVLLLILLGHIFVFALVILYVILSL